MDDYIKPPPPVPPFLLTLNQAPKDIDGSHSHIDVNTYETYYVFL